MVKNGTGGANTQTGKEFEKETRLERVWAERGHNLSKFNFIVDNPNSEQFNRFMLARGFNMRRVYGQLFKPDEAFIYNNHLYVVEKKTQGIGGSVDEKITGGVYKKEIYDTCADAAGLNGSTFIYLLDDYFNQPKFTVHKVPWNLNHGISTYFGHLPFEAYFREAV